MILVDTSLWIDHLRTGNARLAAVLEANRVCTHDFVIGELACGSLRHRREVLALLQSLSRLAPATSQEVLFFIEQHQLMGRGIGYVAVHLLAGTVMHGATIWTRDKRLRAVAEDKGWAYVGDGN